VPFVDQFLSARFQQIPLNLSQLRAPDVTDFVRRQAHRLSPGRAQLLVTALRSFLRYLRHQGKVTTDLAVCVPTVARWSFATLPRFLPASTVQKVLDRNNRQTPVGRRNYAILLLLARLGLRACEIVALNLEDIDWEKASAFGLPIDAINTTLSTAWGSSYVNQFIDGGRVKRVFVQGDAPYRMRPEDFGRWYVRNGRGDTAPFSGFASGHWTHGPPKLERYNGTASIEILGRPASGHSTGEAMQEIEHLIAQLPAGIGHEWTGLSYEERLSSGQAPALYALSLIVVFLCLAALYESWSIPFSVMLVVPLGVMGAVLGALLRGFDNGVYFQVALVTTVGLSAKNAILIVEFAKANVEQGMELIEAAVHAAQQRLRPILMTSLAFMFGVLPLAISSGAGSGAQNAVGTGVVGGTLSATALGVFFVPVFFVVVRSLLRPRRLGEIAAPSTAEAH